jgi:GAF domain-containing protein
LLCLGGLIVLSGVEWLRFLLVVVLLAASLLLSLTSEGAEKSRALGRIMALLAASLSLRLITASPGVTVWRAVYPEAFIGAAGLKFALTFRSDRRSEVLGRIAMAWGAADGLLRLILAVSAGLGSSTSQSAFQVLPRWDWVPTYLLALVAVFLLLRALGDSTGAEHRQLKLFVNGLTVGVAPFVLILPAGAVVPALNEWLIRPDVQPIFLSLTYPFLFVFPVTATYAVLYQGALDYQSALRRAAQYALARYTLLSFVALPLAAGVVLLYVNREEPLGHLLTGWRFLALASVAGIAAGAFPLRYRLLAALDRRYFRESYDARIVLRKLTEAVRKTRDIADLSSMLVEQVDKALHLESVVLMAAAPEQPGILKSAAALGVAEPDAIPASAQFVSLLAGSSEPLSIDASPGSLGGRLPEKEREWLQRAGAALLVPLLGSGEVLTGFLALGRRKSETAFSADDRDLLASVGAAAGLSLETRLLRATPTPGGPGSTPSRDETPPARECLACLGVFESTVLNCPKCGAVTQPALLPLSLLEKYRLESRLGSGGFGVVYAATELRLGRRVALKTLPRISGERVERFKREALAAAAIQHPNLAMIHTAESWNETPILVFELLEGGTLAQRLMRNTLSVVETVELGRAMAGVLEEAHKRGILHRDIKPSNIGFDARRTPKLLDFGVARIRDPSTPAPPRAAETITLERLQERVGEVPQTQDAPLTETGAIVGTPAYMPLEAYQHGEPGPAFDLWALSVTLYEALSGVNPFRAATPAETIERLLRTSPAPLHEVRPDCPHELSELLGRALSRDANERPASAAELSDALHRIDLRAQGRA